MTGTTVRRLPLTFAGAKRCKTAAEALSMRDRSAERYTKGMALYTLEACAAAYAADTQGLLTGKGENTLDAFGEPYGVGKSQVSNWRNTGKAMGRFDLTDAEFRLLALASPCYSTVGDVAKVIRDDTKTVADLRAALEAETATRVAKAKGKATAEDDSSDKAKAGRKAKVTAELTKGVAELAETLDSTATATAKASALVKAMGVLLPRLPDADLATFAKTVAAMTAREQSRRVNATKAKAAKATKVAALNGTVAPAKVA